MIIWKGKKIHFCFCIKDKPSCMIPEQRSTALFLTSRVFTTSESLGSQTSCCSVPDYKFLLKKSTVLADWLALPLLQTTSLLCGLAKDATDTAILQVQVKVRQNHWGKQFFIQHIWANDHIPQRSNWWFHQASLLDSHLNLSCLSVMQYTVHYQIAPEELWWSWSSGPTAPSSGHPADL